MANDTTVEKGTSKRRISYFCHMIFLSITLFRGIVAISTLTAIQLGAGDQPEVRAQILGIAFCSCGLATVLQNAVGSRLPLIHGPLLTFLAPMAAIFSLSRWSDENLLKQVDTVNDTDFVEPWKIRMREAQGSLLLAAATQFVMGTTGMIGFLLKFIGPLTVAPTITITGLYIGGFVLPLCEQHWGIAVLSMALLLIFVMFLSTCTTPCLLYSRTKGCQIKRLSVFQLIPLLLAICVTWLIAYILTVTHSLPANSTIPGYMARTDVRLSAIYNSPWLYFPFPFQFGIPTVSVAGYLGMMATILGSIIKCTGDFITASRVAEMVPPPSHAVNRGIAVLGLSSTVGALIGQLCAATPYSQNIGAIAITKVPSRKVFVTAGVLMILAGVIGKVGAVFTIIPDPVIGGVHMILVGMVAATGVATLQYVDLNSPRNLLIIGTSMMLGVTLPNWMGLHPKAVKTGSSEFDQIVTVLLTNPVFVAGFISCFLDNLVTGTEKERGMKNWQRVTSSIVTGEDTYELPYITGLLRKIKCCNLCPTSPTFDKDISYKFCQTKMPSRTETGTDNGVGLNENHSTVTTEVTRF